MKKKIAVIGSDFTGQLFEDNSDYELVDFEYDQSVISTMAPPILEKGLHLSKVINPKDQNALFTELKKDTIHSLKTSQANVVVMDFMPDLYYGVILEENGSVITNKVHIFKNYPIFRQIKVENSLDPLTNQKFYLNLWKASFKEFAKVLERVLPDTELVINGITFPDNIDNRVANRALTDFYDFIEENYDYKIIKTVYTDNLEAYSQSFFNEFNDLKLPSPKHHDGQDMEFIRNIDFSKGNLYWNNMNNEFLTLNGEMTTNRKGKKGSTMLITDPILIAASEESPKKFEISFDVWIEDIFGMGTNDLYFAVRTYDNKYFTGNYIDAIGFYAKLDNLTSGRWRTIKKTLDLQGPYLYLGPMLRGEAHVKYRNLSLTEIISDKPKEKKLRGKRDRRTRL